MSKRRARNGKTEAVPPALRVFAWNLGKRLTALGKKQIALNVIERGRAWHWIRLPKGWFDLRFCLEHGQKKTKKTLREWWPTRRFPTKRSSEPKLELQVQQPRHVLHSAPISPHV